MAEGGLSIRVSIKNHRITPILDFQPMVNSKDGINLMPCSLPFGLRSPSFDPTSREGRRTPDPALPRVRSRFTTASPLAPFVVKRRSRCREALKPSGFCNDRVIVPYRNAFPYFSCNFLFKDAISREIFGFVRTTIRSKARRDSSPLFE
jgi:hypothetical protein